MKKIKIFFNNFGELILSILMMLFFLLITYFTAKLILKEHEITSMALGLFGILSLLTGYATCRVDIELEKKGLK